MNVEPLKKTLTYRTIDFYCWQMRTSETEFLSWVTNIIDSVYLPTIKVNHSMDSEGFPCSTS